MTQIILFTIAAIVLYLLSDWILNQIEFKRGKRFESRSLIFLVIIMTLSVVSFSMIERLTKGQTGEVADPSSGQSQTKE